MSQTPADVRSAQRRFSGDLLNVRLKSRAQQWNIGSFGLATDFGGGAQYPHHRQSRLDPQRLSAQDRGQSTNL